jgi:hypothetical protein
MATPAFFFFCKSFQASLVRLTELRGREVKKEKDETVVELVLLVHLANGTLYARGGRG